MADRVVLKHMKISVRGVFNLTPEIWSYSLKFKSIYPLDPDMQVADIDQAEVKTALTTFHTGASFDNRVWCTGWRAYDIGTNGKMVGNPVIVDFPDTDFAKGTSGTSMPLQTSMCVTLEAANRGPARYGRFYLPLPGTTPTADSRYSAAAIDGYLTTVTTMLKALSNACKPQDDVPLVNVSAEKLTSGGPYGSHGAVNQEVKRIKIGLVPDVIRRRANGLQEEHRSGADIDW